MKRRLIPILALLLALAPMTAHAQSFPLSWTNENGAQFSLLLDEQGQPLTDPQEYSDIYAIDLDNGWFAAHSVAEFGSGLDAYNLFYALMNAQGQALTEEKYRGLYAAYADRIIFMGVESEDGSCPYGLLDASGNEIVPAMYHTLFPDGGTGFYATIDDSGDRIPLYHLDHDGNAQDTGYTCSLYLSDNPIGLCPATDPATGLTGYLNADAQWAIAPQFASAEPFHTNFAAVTAPESNEQYGLIDASGAQILPCEFDWIMANRYIIASQYEARDAQISYVYDRTGTLLFSYNGSVSEYGQYLCGWPAQMDGMELLDTSGNVLRTLSSSEGYFYGDTSADGTSGTLYLYDASDGLTYLMKDANTPYGEGYAGLTFGYSTGDRIFCLAYAANMVYDSTYEYWYPEWASGRYGVIDDAGNVVIPLEYQQLSPIGSTGLYAFTDSTGHGVLDTSGNVLYYRSDYLDLVD
ncbi:MAG: WG repeat-containing protein [Clostridia bacterium]|nr:WG repeat-containing protein [Clostridia bacterium]